MSAATAALRRSRMAALALGLALALVRVDRAAASPKAPRPQAAPAAGHAPAGNPAPAPAPAPAPPPAADRAPAAAAPILEDSAPEPRQPANDDKAASAPAAPPPRAGTVPDLARLRADYDHIREELFKARVRSQKVEEAAYPSKLDARLRWKGGPDFVIRKARILLDGAELWDSADRAQTDDLIEVAERSVKPGPHAFTVRLEVRPKTEAKGGTKTGNDKLGYTAEHTFAIVVPESGRTHLLMTGDEDGDPPEYEPELELEVETEK